MSLSPFILQTIEFDESAGAVLRIQPLRTPRDENIYECVAQNPHGEVTVHAKLTVLRGKDHVCLRVSVSQGRRDPSASPFSFSLPSDEWEAYHKMCDQGTKSSFFLICSDLSDLFAVTIPES